MLLAMIAWPALASGGVMPCKPDSDAVPDDQRTSCARLVDVRDVWAERGLSMNLELTYTFQGVAAGGLDGRVLERLSGHQAELHAVPRRRARAPRRLVDTAEGDVGLVLVLITIALGG
jgi:hypothetical protein